MELVLRERFFRQLAWWTRSKNLAKIERWALDGRQYFVLKLIQRFSEVMTRSGVWDETPELELHSEFRNRRELDWEGWLTWSQTPFSPGFTIPSVRPWTWLDFLILLSLRFFIFKMGEGLNEVIHFWGPCHAKKLWGLCLLIKSFHFILTFHLYPKRTRECLSKTWHKGSK